MRPARRSNYVSIAVPFGLIAAADQRLRPLLQQAIRQAADDVRAGRSLPAGRPLAQGPAAGVTVLASRDDVLVLRVACARAGRSVSSVVAEYGRALVRASTSTQSRRE
jgi:hypothetical protein